jgi:hypothetical protein
VTSLEPVPVEEVEGLLALLAEEAAAWQALAEAAEALPSALQSCRADPVHRVVARQEAALAELAARQAATRAAVVAVAALLGTPTVRLSEVAEALRGRDPRRAERLAEAQAQVARVRARLTQALALDRVLLRQALSFTRFALVRLGAEGGLRVLDVTA